MFYFIVAVLLLSFYLFLAPKSIKGTINIIAIVGLIALVILLALLTFFRIMQSPPEFFIALFMIIFAYFPIKDVVLLSNKPEAKVIKNVKTYVNDLYNALIDRIRDRMDN